MERTTVSSSSLNSVRYDNSRNCLDIEFQSGKLYRYFDVPSSVHNNLLNAPSKGKYFATHIRDKFRSEKLY